MMFNVLGADVVFGGALASTVCNTYLRTAKLGFLCDFVYDCLDLSLWCDGEKKHVSGPTLYEHLTSLNFVVAGAGSGERYVFLLHTRLLCPGLSVILFCRSSFSGTCK